MLSVFFWSLAETLLCGVDCHKVPIKLHKNNWTLPSALTILTQRWILMQQFRQSWPEEPDLLVTPVLTNRGLFSDGHQLNVTQESHISIWRWGGSFASIIITKETWRNEDFQCIFFWWIPVLWNYSVFIFILNGGDYRLYLSDQLIWICLTWWMHTGEYF